MSRFRLWTVAVTVLLLAGCSPAASAGPSSGSGSQAPGESTGGTQPLAKDQVLTLYLSDTDPATLNPSAAQDSVSTAVLTSTQRPLLYYDKDLNLVPSLATALPAVSDGGKTLTYTLRSNAKYASGDPIVAGDLVRAFRRLVDPRAANPYNYIVCPMAGVAALLGSQFGCGTGPTPTNDATIEDLLTKIGAEAPDDHTFVVRLATPATYFAAITAMWLTVPQPQSWTGFAEADQLGASGPFMVQSWDHNAQITLVPNPNWYGDVKPTLTEVQLQIGGDPEAALASFEQGDLDTVVVPGTSIRRVEQDPALTDLIQDIPQLSLTYYDYANCQEGPDQCPDNPTTPKGEAPTANKEFRIALTQAVNKQQFLDLTFGGIGQVANSIVMPGIPGYDADYNPYPYDVPTAQGHMATALQELGTKDTNGDGKVTAADIGVLKFGYNCNAGHLPRVAFLAEAWRTGLGFAETSFDISCSDFPTFLQERPNGKYDVSRDGWAADFPHAVNQLSDLFRCGGGNNNSQYCNPAFDSILDEAAVEADPAAAVALYQKAQRQMLDDAAVLPLRFGLTRYLVQTYVEGLTPTSSDHQNVGDLFLENVKIIEH